MRVPFALPFLLASSAALAQGAPSDEAAPATASEAPPASDAAASDVSESDASENDAAESDAAEAAAAPDDEGTAPAEQADPPASAEAAAAPPPTPAPAAPVAESAAAPPEAATEPAAGPCPPSVPCLESADFAFWPSLRLRAGYELVQPDDDVLFVGHNDGFFLDQARVGFESSYRGRFFARLVLDMASVAPGARKNDPVQPLLGAARDAYVAWVPSDYFFVAVGQQFMPFDYEGQVSRGELNFTTRSVAIDGVRAGRGFEVDGLGPDRQVGVVLGAKKAPIGPVNLDYRLAVTNGNDKNHRGNDNKLPALFTRLGASLGDWIGLGVAAQLNPRTTGALPNQFTETHTLLAADVRLDVFGIDVLAQGVWRRVSFDDAFLDPLDPNAADQSAGLTGWIVLDEPFGLPMFGFKPGYRFSYYDPFFSDPHDQLMENTISLRYDPPTPLRLSFFLEGTLLTEHAELDEDLRASPRYLDNNRVVALVQFEL